MGHSTLESGANSSKACGFLHVIFLTLSHHYGLGRHFFYLDDVLRVKSQEMEFISEPFGKDFLNNL